MTKYFGTATVKADGKEFKLEDVEFTPDGIVREDKLDGRGYCEKEQGGKITGKLYVGKNTDIKAINKIDDATLVVSLDTGQVFSCPHAWIEQPESITKDGMTVTFKFKKSEKIS